MGAEGAYRAFTFKTGRSRKGAMLMRSAAAMQILLQMLAFTQPMAAHADAVADFYRNRTVNLVVGYGPGGGYDLCARLIARHIGRHIPGNPTVVVQNMPGAGSLRATNYLYAVAPKDGATIGAFARDMPLLAVLGTNSGVRFDPRKFTWLGSSSSFTNDAYILMVRSDAPVKSIEEARRPGGPTLVLASTAEGTTGNDVPLVLRDALGLNIKLVAGYPDNGAIFLAVDRGEVNGRTADLTTVKALRPDWLKPNGGMRALVQFARANRHPDFVAVPTARELANDPASRALIELAELSYMMARPFVAPPGVPAERAAALQAAFLAVHRDPQFLADVAQLKIEVDAVGAEAVLEAIDRIAEAPSDLLDRLRKLLTKQ
jgi:tripartite-type tricarboxylate transporter receptor subunit TctC